MTTISNGEWTSFRLALRETCNRCNAGEINAYDALRMTIGDATVRGINMDTDLVLGVGSYAIFSDDADSERVYVRGGRLYVE